MRKLLFLPILPVISFYLFHANIESGTPNTFYIAGVALIVVMVLYLVCFEKFDAILYSWFLSAKKKFKKHKVEGEDRTQKILANTMSFPNHDSSKDVQENSEKIQTYVESYDQLIENQIRDQWNVLIKENNIEKEKVKLKRIRESLKSKRYDVDDDWVVRLWNFIRPRPLRLQKLLFEIKARLRELEQSKKVYKDKQEDPSSHSNEDVQSDGQNEGEVKSLRDEDELGTDADIPDFTGADNQDISSSTNGDSIEDQGELSIGNETSDSAAMSSEDSYPSLPRGNASINEDNIYSSHEQADSGVSPAKKQGDE